ncbi:MAG: Integrator complex subunit 8, variant 4 [Marteilia pararefringens]
MLLAKCMLASYTKYNWFASIFPPFILVHILNSILTVLHLDLENLENLIMKIPNDSEDKSDLKFILLVYCTILTDSIIIHMNYKIHEILKPIEGHTFNLYDIMIALTNNKNCRDDFESTKNEILLFCIKIFDHIVKTSPIIKVIDHVNIKRNEIVLSGAEKDISAINIICNTLCSYSFSNMEYGQCQLFLQMVQNKSTYREGFTLDSYNNFFHNLNSHSKINQETIEKMDSSQQLAIIDQIFSDNRNLEEIKAHFSKFVYETNYFSTCLYKTLLMLSKILKGSLLSFEDLMQLNKLNADDISLLMSFISFFVSKSSQDRDQFSTSVINNVHQLELLLDSSSNFAIKLADFTSKIALKENKPTKAAAKELFMNKIRESSFEEEDLIICDDPKKTSQILNSLLVTVPIQNLRILTQGPFDPYDTMNFFSFTNLAPASVHTFVYLQKFIKLNQQKQFDLANKFKESIDLKHSDVYKIESIIHNFMNVNSAFMCCDRKSSKTVLNSAYNLIRRDSKFGIKINQKMMFEAVIVLINNGKYDFSDTIKPLQGIFYYIAAFIKALNSISNQTNKEYVKNFREITIFPLKIVHFSKKSRRDEKSSNTAIDHLKLNLNIVTVNSIATICQSLNNIFAINVLISLLAKFYWSYHSKSDIKPAFEYFDIWPKVNLPKDLDVDQLHYLMMFCIDHALSLDVDKEIYYKLKGDIEFLKGRFKESDKCYVQYLTLTIDFLWDPMALKTIDSQVFRNLMKCSEKTGHIHRAIVYSQFLDTIDHDYIASLIDRIVDVSIDSPIVYEFIYSFQLIQILIPIFEAQNLFEFKDHVLIALDNINKSQLNQTLLSDLSSISDNRDLNSLESAKKYSFQLAKQQQFFNYIISLYK